ncbi:hypothetical protein KJ365_02710 [Glaciecola sp. XM2]|uniref:hypothetical protein n=1 Tax=Glaciecola sp. XM2 TaxID=1914931 RepID=UPI001BDE57C6|nr:hypothetical protein [Glaciecola sp. XM2]MBT1449777.1 hypothetical protein [Glaciecola sp. XM2]
MEDILGEIFRGFLRVIGYILAEIFFWTICYWLGWPICKLFSFGRYPKTTDIIYFGEKGRSGFWCAATGLIVIIVLSLFFLGAFG